MTAFIPFRRASKALNNSAASPTGILGGKDAKEPVAGVTVELIVMDRSLGKKKEGMRIVGCNAHPPNQQFYSKPHHRPMNVVPNWREHCVKKWRSGASEGRGSKGRGPPSASAAERRLIATMPAAFGSLAGPASTPPDRAGRCLGVTLQEEKT